MCGACRAAWKEKTQCPFCKQDLSAAWCATAREEQAAQQAADREMEDFVIPLDVSNPQLERIFF